MLMLPGYMEHHIDFKNPISVGIVNIGMLHRMSDYQLALEIPWEMNSPFSNREDFLNLGW